MMEMTRLIRCMLCCMIGLFVATTAEAAQQRPRLFITAERLAEMRRQIAVEDSTHRLALADLQARVANPDIAAAYGSNATYRVGYKAVEAAFLSALVEDEAPKQRYADIAFESMMSWRGGSATLGRAMQTRCLALTYDWAQPVWTDQQRQRMQEQLQANVEHLAGLSHVNLGADRSSNFVGVIRGAELLGRLALGDELEEQRVRQLIDELRRHLAHFSDLGTSQEGLGYIEYPGGFLLPAVLATHELGDSTLYQETTKHAFWKLALYTRTFAGLRTNRNLMWGVDHGASHTEGWSSLLLGLCPEQELPSYVYWYDRHVGRAVEGKAAEPTFDADRHGTVWAMLYYPGDIEPQDPTGRCAPAVADNHGYIFFRNRWSDADDVLVSIAAQTHRAQRGWNQPEQLAINLMAYGTRFIGGPGKRREIDAYSSLLVDGRYTDQGASARTGEVVAFEPNDTGGYAIVRGGPMYQAMGAAEATRHMLVRFLPDNRAIVATLDRVRADTERTWTWQANVGLDEAVTLSEASEGGRAGFLLGGRDKSFVRGWALTPGDAQLENGEEHPLRISAQGTETEILVVMLIGRGEAPEATIHAEGPDTQLKVAGRTIFVHPETGRIVCQ